MKLGSFRLLLPLALATALASRLCPGGESFVAADGQRFYMDLDARDAAFSEWRHQDISSMSEGIGELEITRLGTNSLYFPRFAIWVESEAGYAGLALTTPNDQQPIVVKRIQGRKRAASREVDVPGTVAVHEKTPFRALWSSNSVSFQIGTQQLQRFTLPRPPTCLVISSSSGGLKIHGLTLGHSGR